MGQVKDRVQADPEVFEGIVRSYSDTPPAIDDSELFVGIRTAHEERVAQALKDVAIAYKVLNSSPSPGPELANRLAAVPDALLAPDDKEISSLALHSLDLVRSQVFGFSARRPLAQRYQPAALAHKIDQIKTSLAP